MANTVKNLKKKGKRLKRTIRKTLGTLFLVSALVVAAIPVDYLQADGDINVAEGENEKPPYTDKKEEMRVSIKYLNDDCDLGDRWKNTSIPNVNDPEFRFPADRDTPNIYRSENLVFDFVVSNIRGEGRYAAIVGYNNQKQVNNAGKVLTIPKTVDAYAPYGSENGTLENSFSCAIGGTKGELLFYRTLIKAESTDQGGNVIPPVYKYMPCLFKDKDDWAPLEWDGKTNPNSCLFYISGLVEYNDPKYVWEEGIPVRKADGGDLAWLPADQTMTERFKDIDVNYIANQYVKSTNQGGTVTTEICHITKKEEGIFTSASVETLKVEPNLKGVGKYAFAGTHISNVELSDSVVEIGSYAFEDCQGLKSFRIGESAIDVVVGDHAFAGCTALEEFDASNIRNLGDSAFEGCSGLKSVDFLGAGVSGKLRNLGYYAFAKCIALEEIIFPAAYGGGAEGKTPINVFMGCTKLKRIYATGETISFDVTVDESGYYPFEKFKADCDPNFYFEGPKDSNLQKTVIPEYFVYKYSEQEIYKKKVPDEASKNEDGTYGLNAIFEVTRLEGTETGKISNAEIESGLKNLNIPGKVGPLNVVEIGEKGFKDNKVLQNVIIPSTITTIGAEAFMGCNNLENVLFDNPAAVTDIGGSAFKTQEGGSASEAKLNFVSNTPYSASNNSLENTVFNYAMDAGNTVNNNGQPTAYIKYYTGWPSNLVVQYNKDTDKNTLIEYPTFAGLLNGSLNDYYYKPDKEADYRTAVLNVAKKLFGTGGSDAAETGYEGELKAAIENITIPTGVEAVAKDLFKNGEAAEGNAIKDNNVAEENKPKKKFIIYGLESIEDNAFEAAEFLNAVDLIGNTKSIGAYAFKDCGNLASVTMTAPVEKMGNAPFIGCNKLATANIGGTGNHFTCVNSIIYELNEDGSKKALVEYLNGRGSGDVKREEAEGITAIYPEAFKNTDVRTVDLSAAQFETLSKGAFQNTLGTNNPPGLQSVILPASCSAIEDDAFTDSTIRDLTVPNMRCILNDRMFRDVDGDGKYTNPKDVTLYSPAESLSQPYGEGYMKEWIEYTGSFTVDFWGYDEETGEEDGFLIESIVNVESGKSVVAPADDKVPVWPDHEFKGWDSDEYLNVTRNLSIKAVYSGEYNVVFYDSDWKTVLFSTSVLPGKTVNPPSKNDDDVPIPSWRNKATGEIMSEKDIRSMPITQDLEFIAEYSGDGTGPSASPSPSPGPGGQTPAPGTTPTPGPGGQTPAPGATPTPGPGGNVPNPDGTFSLEVRNGKGSGNYVPGSQVIIEADPAPEGQKFIGWDISPEATVVTDKERAVTILTMPSSDVAALAKYESKNGTEDPGTLYTLQVLNGSGSGTYPAGTQVIITANTPAENQVFSGWDISPAETVVSDASKVSTVITMPANDAAAIANFTPKDGGATPSPAPTGLHSLVVHNGSGSGSYAVGAQIVITANDPAPGQTFTGWTVSPDSTVITDKTLPGAVVTMPDNDVAVIANYKSNGTGSGNTSGSNTGTNNNNNSGSNNNNNSGSGGNSSGTTNRPSSTARPSSGGGTTVVIDKNGLSNTGVVSATVNGSSDNFTIKVTESSEATEAIVKALLAEFGSIDNIKYFPMDISLYDSTGNTKITDTTGLSVSITLPLPDSLITYAGNNKVAGVVNDRLDKLTPRFTTINGVSCVTFTAEHFSPYVIYVDVTNLSDGTITDNTPTTGDGIHPKWFLSIGLACLSFVMFMIKDGKAPRKKKAVVRA